ncbi:MAG: TIM barrel protein [Chloroflexi bacterium]|jgi:hydroxypyruvate isomerase|nr:TIM barrel protein [Chloroflexota bacterium]
MLSYSLNISSLLREYAFVERFDQARRLGFNRVEFLWPNGEDPLELAKRGRAAQVQAVLINFYAGNLQNNDRGLLNSRDRWDEFCAQVPIGLELAQALGCNKMHALAGRWRNDESPESQLARLRDRYRWLCEQAKPAGVTVLIEHLCPQWNGNYIFKTSRDTLAFIDSVGVDNLGLQYDVFNAQRVEGDIIATIRELWPRMAHIQIADSPDRHEPGTGELNFANILRTIDQSGYAGFVGLEYWASGSGAGSTEQSLAWMR